ncbi:MAG: AAA family ATPase [Planctomycetaceae bacterium]
MYETHFGFHRQPFQSADASRAFFVSESIRAILPQLLHALRSDLGIAVLTGVPGSGKTSFLRHIQQQLSNEGRVIVCSGASLGTSVDLMSVLLQASRMKAGSESTTTPSAADPALRATRSSAMELMKRTAELWGPILLLIDDVHLVPLPVLNELRACTEEEWNGRDLVRCLVSAPISFEEQLARSEYAEFGRRIRCHAFLQPLKSVESIRFLQEQIERAGCRLSQILTTPALELIAAAADGIPRCLSLLADETLVVAAECSEKPANEQSVRTALGRLQHLHYNWNVSPHADMTESTVPEDEDSPEEPIGQTTLLAVNTTVNATVNRQTPTRATLSPGVIEFGGPSRAATEVHPAEPSTVASTAPSTVAAGSIEIEPTIEVADREPDSVAPPECEVKEPSVFEFGVPQSIADFARSQQVTFRQEASAPFEVGRRFLAESSEDSICIENVDDSDIVDLLNSCGEFEHEPWGFIWFPDTSSPIPPIHSSSTLAQIADPEIVWIDGNEGHSEATRSDVVVAPNEATAVATSATVEQAEFTEKSPEPERVLPGQPAGKRIVAASGRAANFGFVDLGDSRMSNRTPVFDRYTWLALGREVPSGVSSVVSQTKSKQLMLADYGMLATNQMSTLCLQTASGRQTASMDQILITRTTDSILIDEILHRSASREAGSFELFRSAPCAVAVHEIPGQAAPQNDHRESPLRLNNQAACDEPDRDCLEADVSEDATHTAIDAEAEVLVSAETSPAFAGLKIWHDGQLIFSHAGGGDSPDAAETVDQHSGIIGDAVDKTAHTQPEPVTTLNQGGFFTLPIPIEKIDWDLLSAGISSDQDVFPIVESVTGLRADLRQFQQSGRASDSEAGSTERVFSPDAEVIPDSDTLISRARRRLDDRTAVTDSAVVALQMAPDARSRRAAAAADSEAETAANSSPASGPQFSRLFTRLWENRRRTAGQPEGDR